jgi:phage gpG-like protein
MDARLFEQATRRQAQLVARYVIDQAPGMVVRETMRFINGNFTKQGWQGSTFQKWDTNKRKGTILVKSGALRRSINYKGAGAGAVLFYSNVPYASIHNRGGKITATANVREHERRIYKKMSVAQTSLKTRKTTTKIKKLNTGVGGVKAHTRKMNISIDQRQFAPYKGHESPVLNGSITRELEREITKIFTTT